MFAGTVTNLTRGLLDAYERFNQATASDDLEATKKAELYFKVATGVFKARLGILDWHMAGVKQLADRGAQRQYAVDVKV